MPIGAIQIGKGGCKCQSVTVPPVWGRPVFTNVSLSGGSVFTDAATDNLLVGSGFPAHTTGDENVGFGPRVFDGLTTGNYNCAFGLAAMETITTGTYNTAFGRRAMAQCGIAAGDNCAFGTNALERVSGPSNSAFGVTALALCTTGALNSAFGSWCLHDLVDGVDNSAFGFYAGKEITSGTDNTLVGFQAGYKLTTPSGNVAIGASALHSCTVFGDNVAVGRYSLLNCDGSGNVAVGTATLFASTTGVGNVAIGNTAGRYETGDNKLFIDNTARANEADGRIKALIYGIFAAATANQWLRINGHFGILLAEVPAGANNAAAQAAGLAVGDFYRTNADPSVLCIRSA